jgi:cyclase
MLGRRKFIGGSIAGAVALSQSFSVRSQTGLSSSTLSPGIYLIQGAGSNVVLADLADELVVIDGGLQENAGTLLNTIQMLAPGKKIGSLFNTNWRPEHCGLNYSLADSTSIIAHENTRLWQGTDSYVEWEEKQYHPMPVNARANHGFYTGGKLELGVETLSYDLLPKAHTDGDIYLYFEQADILVVSDLLVDGGFPQVDYSSGGWLRGLRDATAALIDIAGDNTQIIASQGPVLSRQNLVQQHDMLVYAWDAVVSAFQNGLSLVEFQAENPMQAYIAERGDPNLFLQQAYRSAWYHITERTIPNVI